MTRPAGSSGQVCPECETPARSGTSLCERCGINLNDTVRRSEIAALGIVRAERARLESRRRRPPSPITGIALSVLAPTFVAVFLFSAAPAEAKECSGLYRATAPGAVLIADRLVAKQISCSSAQRLVRRFLRAQADNIKCAAAASRPGYACYLAPYECEKRGPRASCLDQGYGVTYRQRDRSVG
jgi:hypothetical protein